MIKTVGSSVGLLESFSLLHANLSNTVFLNVLLTFLLWSFRSSRDNENLVPFNEITGRKCELPQASGRAK